jgi:putative tryptophan/tyrosine transport system substrate-binding protein
MRRREFITLLGGAVATWPLAARAQQPDEKTRRIGVLSSLAESDSEAQAWDAAFRKPLVELGWVDGRSIHIDYRWAAGSVDRMRLFARELVQLNPDALVSISTPATAALQAETRTIPIVFAWVSDPVGSGFVSSLAHPGGNITGFLNIETSVIGKWLTLMRDIAPQVSRIGFLYNPQTAPFARYYLDTFRAASPTFAIEAMTPQCTVPRSLRPSWRISGAKSALAFSSCRTPQWLSIAKQFIRSPSAIAYPQSTRIVSLQPRAV